MNYVGTSAGSRRKSWNIRNRRRLLQDLREEMDSLYLLAFLLTADKDKAEQCFVGGLGDCVERIGVFMEWARSSARLALVKHAIRMIRPAAEEGKGFFVSAKWPTTSGTSNPLCGHCFTLRFRTICLCHVGSRRTVSRRMPESSQVVRHGSCDGPRGGCKISCSG